jgi:dolichyldiphosphatase
MKERPTGPNHRPEMFGKGYGMPSSHSQFVAFFSLSLSLFLLLRHQTTHHTSYRPSTFLERLFVSILACFCAVTVAVSRVYLTYHTPRQVCVGFGAGLIFAAVWFLFTTYLRSAGWLDWALDLEISRMLRFRDLILTEDLQDAGWGRWEDRRKSQRGRPVANGAVSKKKSR